MSSDDAVVDNINAEATSAPLSRESSSPSKGDSEADAPAVSTAHSPTEAVDEALLTGETEGDESSPTPRPTAIASTDSTRPSHIANKKAPAVLSPTSSSGKKTTGRGKRAVVRNTTPEQETTSTTSAAATELSDQIVRVPLLDAHPEPEETDVTRESAEASETDQPSASMMERPGVKRSRSATRSATNRKKQKGQATPPPAPPLVPPQPAPRTAAWPSSPESDLPPLAPSVVDSAVVCTPAEEPLASDDSLVPHTDDTATEARPQLVSVTQSESTEPPSTHVPVPVLAPEETSEAVSSTITTAIASPNPAAPAPSKRRSDGSSMSAPSSPASSTMAAPAALPFEALRRVTANIAGVNIAALLGDSSQPPPTFSRRMTTRRAKRRPTLFADHPQFLQHRELRNAARARRGSHTHQGGGGGGSGGASAPSGNTVHGMVMGSHGHLYPPFFTSPFSTDEDVLQTLTEWTDSVPLVYASLLWKYTPQAFLASAMQHSPCATKLECADESRADGEHTSHPSQVSPVKRERPSEDDA